MLRIVNVSHDPVLGTMAFIYRIRDLLVEKFSEAKKKNKNLVVKNNRAMSKLTQEASNVLMKLSANNEIFAQVENVFDGEDLRVKVTRAEMESLCSDLFERIRKPFLDMMSDTPLESLQEVILMGGGTRIPKVQSVLLELSKKTELHKGVNSDEAAALGAVYQAAFHTPGFRVTRFIVKDYNPYPIAVDFMRAPASSDEKLNKDSKTDAQSDSSPYVRQVLFPRGAVFPQKRTIKFNRHVNDLDFYVNYADLDGFEKSFLGPNYNLSHVTTRNVSKSAKQYSFAEPRGVKAHFTMDHNGILILSGVSCIFHPIEKTETSGDSAKEKSTFEKIGNTLSGLFGGGSGGGKSDEEKSSDHDANVNEAVAGGNSTDVNMTSVNNTSTTSDNQTISHDTDTNSGQSQQDNAVKPTVPFPEPIDYEINYVDFPQLPSDVLVASLSKLNKLREADKAKAALEASINQLETLLIDIRDKISTDYAKYGTKEEIVHLEGVLQIISDWFDETGHEGTKDEYDSRIKEMQVIINPMEKRRIEAKHRPKAMSSFDKTLALADKTLAQMIELSNLFAKTLKAMPVEQNESTPGSERSWSNVFTEVEIQTFTNKINETKTWLAQSTDALNKSPTQQDPPVLVSDIQTKEKELSREIVYHTTKMDLWRSEIARMFAEQTKMNFTASQTVKPDEGEKVVKGGDDKSTVEPVVIQKDEESKKSTPEPTPTPRPEL
ncbi:unnamed protein product [Trichobilharzia szidati]|nr:unnamed protein product [Trichobilharzia szidati]CAH8834291.1 unnamed protein product [Trichobilharzia szidati]